ncbi:uncharacterized protein LOC144341407 [Macaca mulatta]
MTSLSTSPHLAGRNDAVRLSLSPKATNICTCTAAASFPAPLRGPSSQIHPPTPCDISLAGDEKGTPRGTVLLPYLSLRPADTPVHPVPRTPPTPPPLCSLTGLSPGEGCGLQGRPEPLSQLRPRRAPQLPAPASAAALTWAGRLTALGCALRAARGRCAGRPGLGPRGAEPPTRKNSPNSAAAGGHVTAALLPPRPAPLPGPGFLPARPPPPDRRALSGPKANLTKCPL